MTQSAACQPHCLLTGSSSGIGAALAKRLLAQGWRVTGLDRNPQPDDLGPAFQSIVVDLLDDAALDSAVKRAIAAPTTAFVHCAGIMRTGRVTDTKTADLETLWRLHVGVPVAIMRQLAAHLPDRDGRVVLMSSRGALGRAGRGAYAATKSALSGLARSWAIELAPRGVTVNVVGPGATDTPMLTDPSRAEKPQIDMPIGRLIKPEEVASLIGFLLAAESGAITGQTIYICGGSSLSTST